MVNAEQIAILKQGTKVWNTWREDNMYQEDIYFAGADLSGIKLSDAMLAHADFFQADLRGVDLRAAILVSTEFRGANLSGADLSYADLHGANLGGANLSRANLTGARLTNTTLVEANLKNAILTGCRIYGSSAWDVQLRGAEQLDLIITPDDQAEVTVDDLEVAQFVYLLLNNKKIRNVIDTIGKKGVLILGRFTPERKAVLNAIRGELRRLDYVPMMFDFDKPTDKDFTETIMTLAGMSRFIIADITNPKSSPLELQAAVPNYMVPFVPIIQEDEKPFSMFKDLYGKFDWVLKPLEYDTIENLIPKLEKGVINRALEKHKELQLRKAEDLQTVKLEDL